MKTITLGNAYAAGYEVVGEFDGMPEAVKRLAEYDIKIVVASGEFLSMYDEHELEILKSTISRYGARLEVEENAYEELAEEYACRYGIIEYEVRGNKMIFVERYDYGLYQSVVNLDTMKETREKK